MHKLPLIIALGFTLAACGQDAEPPAATAAADQAPATTEPAAEPTAPELSMVEKVMAGEHRSDKNKGRDAWRNPAETLDFFVIRGSESVIEITPGGGWYSEVLAPYMKDNGKLIAAVIDPTTVSERAQSYYTESNQNFRDKLAADADNYGNVQVIEFDSAKPVLGEPDSVERVLTFRNVHNWSNSGNDQAMFDAFFAVLEPGGLLGVVEHRAAEGTSVEDSMKSGYIAEAAVIAMAEKAGFVLDGKSEINANPADTRDHPTGVWNLPPNLRMKEGDEDQAKYEAIGESDRMTLRFSKPSDT